MKEPCPQDIIMVLEHLSRMWKEDVTLLYLLERYTELEEYLK